ALDSRCVFGELRGRCHWEAWVAANRIPGIGEASCPAQGRRTLAACPDRRVRLLHGLWRECDVGEAAVLALERRIVARPQFLEGANVFIANGPALVIGRCPNRLVLLAHPPHTTADDEAPVGEHID